MGEISLDKHGVAIAEKAVAVLDGFMVGVENFFAAFVPSWRGEGADQH